jgi:hypothetical protein
MRLELPSSPLAGFFKNTLFVCPDDVPITPITRKMETGLTETLDDVQPSTPAVNSIVL